MAKQLVDFTGQRFGRLTVVSLENRGKNPKWKCLCDCGNTKIASSGNLKAGHIRSCGCLQKESQRDPELMKRRKANGFLPRVAGDQYSRMLTEIVASYKAGARTRHLQFRISKDEISNIINQPCYFCGTPPNSLWKSPITGEEFYWNGIDRMNNDVGYVIENCVPCCAICNKMKSTHSFKDFLGHIQKIISAHARIGA